MIAVSSYRPFGQAEEVDRNQLAAVRSWATVFDKIYYLSPKDVRLDPANVPFPKVFFVGEDDSNPKPAITALAFFAGELSDDWAVLINADIQLTPKVKTLPEVMMANQAVCGMSLRVEPGKTQVADLGLDFFIARKDVWARCAVEFNPAYRLGVQMWDTAMLSWMVNNYPNGCVDLSRGRMVIHPKHGNRNDQHMEKPKDDPWIDRVAWPKRRIVF